MKKLVAILIAGILMMGAAMAAGYGDAGTKGGDAGANWPKQPITLIVPFGAGGNSDNNARVLAKYLQTELGQPVVIQNVAGAGGSIGAAQVKDAKPDGYTVLVHQISINMAQISGVSNFGYADFESVCVFSRAADEMLYVRTDSGWNTFDDMMAATKANPGKYKITANNGASTQWIAIALKNAGAGFNVVPNPNGSGERTTMLIGGHVDVVPLNTNMMTDYVAKGEVKPLACVSGTRSPAFPDVPTLAEKGVACSYAYDNTFFMPKGTDPAIVKKFADACEKIIKTNKEYQAEIAKMEQVPTYLEPAGTAEQYRKEMEALTAIQADIRGK